MNVGKFEFTDECSLAVLIVASLGRSTAPPRQRPESLECLVGRVRVAVTADRLIPVILLPDATCFRLLYVVLFSEAKK